MFTRKKKKIFRRTKRQKLKENRIRRRRKKTQKNSSKKKQNKSINWKKKMVEFLFVCFVCLVIWVLFFSGVLRIKKVEVQGGDKQFVMVEVKNTGDKKIFNKISRDNLILFSLEKLKENIKRRDLAVKHIDCQRKFPNTLVINIVKRRQLFLWKFGDNKYQLRGESGDFIKELHINNNDLEKKCFELSKQTGLQCVIFINENADDFGDDNKIELFSEAARKILRELKKTVYFDEKNIFKTRIFISKELVVQNSKYGQLRFDLSDDIDRQIKVLKLFFEQKIDMNELYNLEYVDLTLENKLIYKFKHNEVLEDEIKDEDKKVNPKKSNNKE